ncbi:MAG TPA: hypothetical protein VNS58_07855 [Puia sp.]|nr:hypothetical protein [Puia sp.]
MCNVTEGFRFCTCVEGKGGTGSEMPDYQWHLTRFIGTDENGPMGSIVAPSRDMGEGLTLQTVLEILNGGHAFDFAYSPAEKDSLRISRSAEGSYYEYMSLLYEEGQWREGMNPPFTTEMEEIASGQVFNKK